MVGFTGCTVSTGEKNISESASILFFPNPTNGLFKFDLPEAIKDFEVNVYNSFGQKIYTSNNLNQIDLTKQSNGVFLIEVKTKAEIYKGKIIKTE